MKMGGSKKNNKWAQKGRKQLNSCHCTWFYVLLSRVGCDVKELQCMINMLICDGKSLPKTSAGNVRTGGFQEHW